MYSFSAGEKTVYPLDNRHKGYDKKGKNKAKLSFVKFVKGPYGMGSVQFYGHRRSYVEIPRTAALDTFKSTTLIAWVLNQGKSGPIINYNPTGWGVHLWIIPHNRVFVRFTKRRSLRFTKPLISRSRGQFRRRGWNLIAATYNYVTGYARLFINYKKVAERKIGRIKLATNYAIRLGARIGDRRYFKGRIACLQIIAKALRPLEIIKASKACLRRKF